MTRRMVYMPPKRGGRLDNILTFCDACVQKQQPNSTWTIDTTLQSGDEAADEFSHVGVALLNGTNIVVKLMIYGLGSRKEQSVQHLFAKKPHVNIVQPICSYVCDDSPIKWQSHVQVPQAFCTGGPSRFAVIVQEFIPGGSVRHFDKWTDAIWVSITLQLTFACLELYESYGFIYDDWHSGNILLDTTTDSEYVYRAFNKKWKVSCVDNIMPVLTDFARCSIIGMTKSQHLEPCDLASEISIVWDMMRNSTQNIRYLEIINDYVDSIGSLERICDIIRTVKAFHKDVHSQNKLKKK